MITVMLKNEAVETFNHASSLRESYLSFGLWGHKKNAVSVFFRLMINQSQSFEIYEQPLVSEPLEIPKNFKYSSLIAAQFQKRYSAIFNLSMEELNTALRQETTTEIAGQPIRDYEKIKSIEEQLNKALICFNIDILNEKNSQWQRLKTIKKSEVTIDNVCETIEQCRII